MYNSRASTRKSIAVLPQSVVNNNTTPVTRRRSILSNANARLPSRAAPTTAPKTAPITPLVLSRESKTPVVNDETTKARFADPIQARIQRDLNSPSAAARVRANKALKSPTFLKASYGAFDVPHEAQDIITEEERKPFKPKTIREIFADCKIYVEVRTGDDNRSAGIKSRLLRDGITVNEKLYKDTTHVIFKDGLLSTYKNAIKLGIPVTTILWIDACSAQRRLVSPEKFKISNLDRYEHPEMYKRLRRQKSMQPEISKTTKQIFTALEKSFSQDDSRDATKFFENETILQSVVENIDDNGMELTLQNDGAGQTPGENKGFGKNYRRFTTFTPDLMEQTGMPSKIDRRKTIFAQQLSQKTEEEISTPEGFSANSGKTIIFNSNNRIAKSSRRSVFDISMNLLELNCKAIAEKKDKKQSSLEKKETHPTNALTPIFLLSGEMESPAYAMTPSALLKYKLTQALNPAPIRKRRLFNNDDLDTGEYKENMNKSLKETVKRKKFDSPSIAVSKKSTNVDKKLTQSVDRRKTISYFKPEKIKECSITKPKSPAKPAPMKYIVCTNMSATDKQIIQAAITKLGGIVEAEVTIKTTHVVSPNDERTMNILRGVIRACTIVDANWIHDSLKSNKFLDTSVYQHDICDSNRVYQRSILGPKNYKNSTFADRGLLFISKTGIENSKKVDYLKEIVALCGGIITENQSEAAIVISDLPLPAMNPKQVVVISTYIFDSAMKGSYLEVTRYAPKTKKV